MIKKPFFIILLIIIVSEGTARVCYGPPPYESDPPQFKYQYVDVHKKFFRKLLSREDNDIYITQRDSANYTEFSVPKSLDTIRIFIVGESVAALFDVTPFKNVLAKMIPDRNFEIINCGMGGYDSYRTYLVVKEFLSYKPDLIILFSGNNEYYDKVKINLYAYYGNKFLRRFWIYRKLQDKFLQWCVKRRLLYSRDKEKKLIDFERNIRFIIRSARKKEVPMILCTLPVNFRDCPPGGNRPLNKKFLLGHFLLEEGDFSSAIREFEKFLKVFPNNDFGYYFLGCAYDGIGNYLRAKECYLKVLEVSQEMDRASPAINQLIRRICIQERAGLADLELAFINIAPYGLLGREQFLDKCHFYSEYDSLVTEVIIKEIFKNSAIYSHIINSDRYKLDTISFVHEFPPLKEQGRFKYKVNRIIAISMLEIFNNRRRGLSERAIAFLKTLYLINPDSMWKIKLSKLEIIENILRNPWASSWISSADFEVYWPCLLYHIGETYRRLGLYNESLEYFNEAISLDKNNYLPYVGRALTHYRLGNRQKAQNDINRAEQITNNLEVKYCKEIIGF